MKHCSSIRTSIFNFILAMLFLTAGCVSPDRWTTFNSLDAHETSETQNHSAPVKFPEAVHPQLTPEPAFTLPAEGPIDLSIEQVTMLVLKNNKDLHVQELNPVIAGTFEQIERGVYDPELFAELDYQKEQSSETSRSTGTQFSVEGSETSSVAGIRQKLPTGTTLEAVIGHDRSISNRSPEQQEARLGLSITQSLLRGFGPAVNLASVRQAELGTLASTYELRGYIEALLAETETAYWNFVLAKQEIDIFEQSLSVAQQQRDEVELRIEVGILPEIEAAAARAEVARREQALIEAHSLLEESRLRLLQLINLSPDGRLDSIINATSSPDPDLEAITDLSDRIRLAEQIRPDLNEARLRLQQNRLETIVTRNGLLPRLDLFIALGKTGFADTFSGSFRELDGDTYDFTAGVRLSHFLGNRTAEGLNLSARATRRQAIDAVDNLQQLVRLDVRLAVNEVERAGKQISASRVTRLLEEEKLQAEKERFNVGASTALLVAQAQRDLVVSLIAEVEAVVSYRIALVNLYLAEGSLLERRGIILGE
ncbi:MAG: TolC family protein [Nitrospiraceae bacterium]|nr:MAG: TolC family protein [Nitrospiraceae bacterium]